MSKMPHTACPKGKRVRVKLKDGTVFNDIFEERTANKYVILREYGKLDAKDIDSFGILKQREKNTGPVGKKNSDGKLKPSLREVRKNHRASLLKYDGVVGVGAKQGKIFVYVDKTNDKIPEEIEGYKVVIERSF